MYVCVFVCEDETIIKIITIWRFKDTQKENNFRERERHRHKGYLRRGHWGLSRKLIYMNKHSLISNVLLSLIACPTMHSNLISFILDCKFM